MAKVNNLLLVLTILLLFISIFGTVALMDITRFEGPVKQPSNIAKGELKLKIEPGPGSDSVTGRIALNIKESGG